MDESKRKRKTLHEVFARMCPEMRREIFARNQ